jgi:hypothetical protein
MRKFPGEEQLHYEHRRFYQVVKGAIEKKDVAFFTDGQLTMWGVLASVSEATVESIRRRALAGMGAKKACKKRREVNHAV